MIHLRKLLKDRKITQDELARKIGVTQGHISLICNGIKKPGLDVLVKISDALDVSLDHIVRGN